MGVYAVGQSVSWNGKFPIIGYIIAVGRTRKTGVDILLIEDAQGRIYAAPEEECNHHVNGFSSK